MKFNIIASILLILSVILYGEIVLKNSDTNDNNRKIQEGLLKEKQKKVDLPLINEEKIIPKAKRPNIATIQNYYITLDPYLYYDSK